MKQLELTSLLNSLRNGDYQRDNFDKFLKKIKFNYAIPSIHIAGTNGKGSTGRLMRDIYLKEGYKVGYFESPYLFTPLDMIHLDNRNITEEEFMDIYNEYSKYINKYNLSEFEVETLIALTFFKNNNCDIAIIECGMGGETDATNIFTPILSVITSISLEHTDFLGSSLTEIARNKAGIIKEEVDVLVGDLDEESLNAIVEVAHYMDTNVYKADSCIFTSLKADGYYFTFKPFDNLFIPFKGTYILKDASIALSAVNMLKDKFACKEESIRDALSHFKNTARLEVVNNKPLVYVDGAHNPEAMIEIKKTFELIKGDKSLHIIFACFKDKNISSMLGELNFLTKDITLTTFDHPRARTKEEYFLYQDEYEFEDDYQKVIQDKINEYPDDIILITGSLAFASLVSKDFKEGVFKK